MRLHTDFQRLYAAEKQPCIERGWHRTSGVLVELHLPICLFVRCDDGSADDIAVSANVLCRTMHHDVGSQFQRTLEVRRIERIVHHEQGTVSVRDFRKGGYIDQLEKRIRRTLDPDNLRPRRHSRFKTRELPSVNIPENRVLVLDGHGVLIRWSIEAMLL